MGSKIKLIFLVIILSIHPALAKDKVKKDSVKSAEDKVTLVCTYQESNFVRIGNGEIGEGAYTGTEEICSGCKSGSTNQNKWQVSTTDYSTKFSADVSFNNTKVYKFSTIRIDRYSGELHKITKYYSKPDESSELFGVATSGGTCKKMDAPVL